MTYNEMDSFFKHTPLKIDFRVPIIELFSKREVEEKQDYFRSVELHNFKIPKEYIVVGTNHASRDIILTDTKDDNHPIYILIKRQKRILKIADSISTFVKIINTINSSNLKDDKQLKKLISFLDKKDNSDFWVTLVISMYEFIVEI